MTIENGDFDMGGTVNGASNDGQDASKAAKRRSKDAASSKIREGSVEMLDDYVDTSMLHIAQSGASSIGASLVEGAPNPDIPSIDEQVQQVMSLVLPQSHWMREGRKGFAVAYKWLSRVLSRSSDSAEAGKFSKDAREGPIGPVDNSSIWLVTDADTRYKDEKGEEFVFMKPGLVLGDHYEMLPEGAWDLIVKWYGRAEGSPIITRYCHNTSTSEFQDNFQWEQSPPIFTLLKLPDTSNGLQQKDLKERDARPVKILASRSERFQTFLKRAKEKAKIDINTTVRLWRITASLGKDQGQEGILTPAQSRSNSPAPGVMPAVDPGNKLVLNLNTFAQLQQGSQRELVDAKDETANSKYNGKSTLGFYGLSADGVYVLEERVGGPAGGEWVSDATTAKAKTNGVEISVTRSGATTVKDSLKPNAANSRGTSPAPGGMMTRGRQNKMGRSRGTVGLGNLGNTCYMNSALQCVRSVAELTDYFLRDKYKRELNPSNPLSHNGEVAQSYAKLLRDIYDEKQNSSFSPRLLKNVVGKYAPSFSGYQQQDSQEFLLFLLDGLQEDLNRIHKKPYIEKPDSTDEMVNNPVALRQMADQCWEIYKKRNDSVITDLFAGMYKSTLVCPHCNKVSIIFDPFNNLTLQLPIQNIWSKNIWFFPLRAAPFEVAVDIDKNASWSTLVEHIAGKLNLDPKKLVMAEVWQHKLYKIFETKRSINEDNVTDADHIACFELEDSPTNWPAPKKAKKATFSYYTANDEEIIPDGDSPLADRMLVSLFHRRSKAASRYASSKEFFAAPSLMIVTREEAKDYDAILRKCLSRAETLTTREFLREEDMNTAEDSDTVVLSVEDSSDGRFQVESLENEDGMVDISMKDETDRLPKFHRRAPAQMLKRGDPIPDAASNLFEMKVYSSGTEMVPVGFQSFMSDDEKKLQSLSSRLANSSKDESHDERPITSKYQQRRQQVNKDSPLTSDEDEGLPPAAPTAPVDDDNDSDGLPEIRQICQQDIPSTNGFSYSKSISSKIKKTYAKTDRRKAKSTGSRRQSPTLDTEAHQDQPLLRLGECIVLDWSNDGYDALFGDSALTEDEDRPCRGSPTWDNMAVYPDPELEEKRKQRALRRKNGFSLDDCLDEFGKSEILSENDAWYCPRCKEHRRASKTLELWKAPDILVIHLKRFSASGRLNNKLDVFVDFPLEGLDLTSRVATTPDDDKPPVYELFAVDNHYGGLGGGHYTAYAKNFIDGQWYEYNDSFVTRKKDESVVTSAAYILFYRRQSEGTLGGPFFEEMRAHTPSASQTDSRAPSPNPGEGKRLGDSSRNGLSSASQGVGAGHQVGGGGQAGQTVRTDEEEELPSYSSATKGSTMDVDEGIGMDEDGPYTNAMGYGPPNYNDRPPWSFSKIDDSTPHDESLQLTRVPAPSYVGDDRESVNAASDFSNEDNRMADFADDEGTISGPFETLPQGSVGLDRPWESQLYEDRPVAEVNLSPETEDAKEREHEDMKRE